MPNAIEVLIMLFTDIFLTKRPEKMKTDGDN